MGGDDGHLIYWHSVQKELATSGKSLSFLYVAYSLAPQVSYPGQLCECVEALEYLLDGCGRKPSEILLAGDSAGANMVLAILSHLSHPAPDATPIQLDQPVKAAILCSPWVSFSIDWPSIKKNAHKDILWAPYELIWASNYMGGRDLDNYSEPIRTDTKWWEKVRVEQLLCVAGADEAFVDQIDAFMKVYMVRGFFPLYTILNTEVLMFSSRAPIPRPQPTLWQRMRSTSSQFSTVPGLARGKPSKELQLNRFSKRFSKEKGLRRGGKGSLVTKLKRVRGVFEQQAL